VLSLPNPSDSTSPKPRQEETAEISPVLRAMKLASVFAVDLPDGILYDERKS
jgi:hypothetical protein